MLHLPRRLTAAVALCTTLCAVPAVAEMSATLNVNGATGLIDLPSGEMQDDAAFTFSVANAGPMTRATIAFQFSERLSASFRFHTWRDWNALNPADSNKNTNRAFDIRYQLLQESQYLPSLTIGLIDFTGKGLLSSEYIAATKTFGDRFKVTAGLGWGRLGSDGSIGQPFGERPNVGADDQDKPNINQWFRGDAAPFAGVEVKLTDRWTFKGEYSSDAYVLEEGRGIIERESPFNFGFEYQKGPNTRYGVYSLYGTEVGLVFHMILDPKNRATGGVMGAAPVPVKSRPSRASDPDAYDGGWVTQSDAGPLLRKNLGKRLAVDGIAIENMAFTAKTVEVRIRGGRADAQAQVIGRVARALSHVMPASVETFEIVSVANGLGASKVTIKRSDLEALEFAADNATLLRSRVVMGDAGPVPDYALGTEDLYPKFRWGLKPAFRMSSEPLKGDIGARLSASYDMRPGLVFSGSIYGKVYSNIDPATGPSASTLPHVRSDGGLYSANGEIALERLTMAWFARPAENLYSRISFGYLERMHAGVSGELLWKPVESKLGLGVELNYTKQRNTDGMFGFDEYDYDAVSGHVSAYYDFGDGYLGQIDVGRYLAGDYGATISFERVFVNGWSVGAFATLTDASSAEFGDGSFDKGIRFSVPLAWALGNESRNKFGATLRQGGGDGGARLEVDGRLYDSIRDYHSGALDSEWGRVWR